MQIANLDLTWAPHGLAKALTGCPLRLPVDRLAPAWIHIGAPRSERQASARGIAVDDQQRGVAVAGCGLRCSASCEMAGRWARATISGAGDGRVRVAIAVHVDDLVEACWLCAGHGAEHLHRGTRVRVMYSKIY